MGDGLVKQLILRIRRYRSLLAVSVAVFFVLDFYYGGNGLPALAAGVLILIVAGFSGGSTPGHAPHPPALKRALSTSQNPITGTELAAALNDPLYILNLAQGTIDYANEAAISIFGPVSHNMALDLKFRAPEMQSLIEACIADSSKSLMIDYVERVPVERAFRVTAKGISSDHDYAVLFFKDQSEARRIDRMRSDFIANASHELRTPLASISGFIETLRGPARDDEKAREQFLQIMQNQTVRMARLIDDLLSLSRIEAKPFSTPRDLVDLNFVLKSVQETVQQLAAQSGVQIVLKLPEEPFEVYGFHDELVQVFENLVVNACKYGAKGLRVEITAIIGKSGERIVTVRDYGPGISEEHLPRLTERFYRVDSQSSQTQSGTGLGLAIVKHILTRHSARLVIDSTYGEGASFSVYFPAIEH